MPKNCSKDISLVIDYMDDVLMTGSAKNKTDLKTIFGLQDIEHDDDFMRLVVRFPVLIDEVGHRSSSKESYLELLNRRSRTKRASRIR
jgi:hypothetical protein